MNLLKNLARLIAAAATVGLLAAPIASADQGRRGHDNRGGDYSRGHDDRGSNRGHDRRDDYRGDRGRHDNYRDNNRRHDNYRRPPPRYHSRPPARAYYAPPPRYYAPPPHYYAPRYSVGGYYQPHGQTVYIRDYNRYGLYAPPRGHYWARDYDRGDAILASLATGAIIGLVIGVIATD
ncbi:RcnB family protein [Hyphomonas sp.]|jgi:Ni/Co efflux regulator RcnB|uniref:RcnB family protein n=1 Tax=Hyphomonas sp. TaxID=87 RepID=UPI0039E6BC78